MNRRLTDWLDSAQGAALRHTESALLGEALEDCFGWELLQVGAWGTGRELIAKGRTRSQAVLASAPGAGVDVLTRLTQLPIASDSVDCVVLPHTLEFEADPYAVLREVDRVLAGEGKLLVLGFAPFSPWGARALAAGAGRAAARRLAAPARLRDQRISPLSA
jgi:SAM-dependent methyltransferase